VLELNHPHQIGSHVRNVFLAIISSTDELLPLFGELPFPVAMPFGFVLPPVITSQRALM
jgi:hypothetical protein